MLEDGILQKKQLGKMKAQIFLADPGMLNDYLHNQFGIGDLDLFIEKILGHSLTRAGSVHISGDSKLKTIRTFSGFLANVYHPVKCEMQGKPFVLNPLPGSFTFVHDYKTFLPGSSVTVVGIENAENFSQIEKQSYLFRDMEVLFVSRYPQSNDLVKWLQAIPNAYLHFGDLDFEGINIYNHEFKKHLGDRAGFFIPPQTENYLVKYGNRTLYNKQLSRAADVSQLSEKNIQELTYLLHQHKKVLEQEVFIGLGV